MADDDTLFKAGNCLTHGNNLKGHRHERIFF
jgi:hypothetical protein